MKCSGWKRTSRFKWVTKRCKIKFRLATIQRSLAHRSKIPSTEAISTDMLQCISIHIATSMILGTIITNNHLSHIMHNTEGFWQSMMWINIRDLGIRRQCIVTCMKHSIPFQPIKDMSWGREWMVTHPKR